MNTIASHLEQVSRDLRLALRRLRATPVFTALAIVSIALGLGVTTAVYSTVSALAWSGSSVDGADRLAVIRRQADDPMSSWRFAISKPDFRELRSQMHSVPALAAFFSVSGVLNDGAQSSVFRGQAVTGNYFSIVRLPMGLGRGIEESDDRSGAEPVVVLSHEFWQSKASGDPKLVGRTVRIDGRAFVVIGVLSEAFQNGSDLLGPSSIADGDVWIPVAAHTSPATTPPPTPATNSLTTGSLAAASPTTTPQPAVTIAQIYEPELTVLARLPDGGTIEAVAAEVHSIGATLDRSMPLGDGNRRARSWFATTAATIAREQSTALVRAGVAIVLLVGLVLVVACTNIANLTLGRGASRQQEFGIQRALGATRVRLVRELCLESVVLAVCGGAGALLIARTLMHALTTDLPDTNARVTSIHPVLNATALITAGASLLVSLIVFGLIPAMQLTRASLRDRLAGDAAGAPPTRWKGRGRLIAVQVAISTAFMLIAFTSMRAVTSAALQDPGFHLQHLAVASVNFRSRHWDTARAQQAIASIDAAARTQPAFTSVALTMGLPLGEGNTLRRLAKISTADRELTVQSPGAPTVRAMPSTPAIFRTLDVPILSGRAFDAHDDATTSPVIVISEDAARQVFGVTDVVGLQMRYLSFSEDASRSVEVIGVAQDVNARVFDRKIPTVYLPLAQQDAQSVLIVGRADGDPASMLPAFAGIVRQADPDLAVEFAATGPMVMTPLFVILRVGALLSSGLSILAVSLAMLGLYGVLSHVVARRTREIGVRLALGAEAARVRRMIVGEGLRPVVWGLGVGLFVGTGARLVLRAIGAAQNISAIDPLAVAVAAVTLVAAGFAASYLPAHRASKVDPNVALRTL